MEPTVWTDDLECEVCPVTRDDVVSPVILELWGRLVLLDSGVLMEDLGSPDERDSLEIMEGMETRGLDDLAREVKMVLPELGVSPVLMVPPERLADLVWMDLLD